MPKLYVANATPQVHAFTYVVPDDDDGRQFRWQPRVQPIAAGGQIPVAGNLKIKQIDSIVAHHRRYGMVEISEIDRTSYGNTFGAPQPRDDWGLRSVQRCC